MAWVSNKTMSPALTTVGVQESAYLEAIRCLAVHDHLCLIYETPEEQFGALVPFIRFGLERGERCVYIADQNTAEQVLDTLDAAGIDVAAATDRDALSVVTKREAYLRDGYFDPERMIALLADSVETARGSGFRALRVTGEMTWALGGAAGSERLMEYESKLNHLFPAADIVAICQYNRRWFPAELIKQVIETHPLVIHGATVCRNPYYVPPEEFMGPRDPSREVDRLLASLVERERSEAALRVSEARLAEAQRLARLGHWEWDIRAGTLAWSDEVYRIFGVGPGAFGNTYEAFLERVRPEDRPRVEHAVAQALERRRPYGIDHGIVLPDGRVRTVHEQAETTFDEAGKPIRMLGTVQDVTERAQAEAARARMAAILEETPDFVSTADVQQGLEFINRAGRRMLGIPDGEDVRGTRVPNVHPAWAYELIAREGIPTAIREGSWIGQTALLARDGREIPVSQVILAHRNAAGDLEYLSTIMRDVSER
jgi:PAS domain S-box-containing protein